MLARAAMLRFFLLLMTFNALLLERADAAEWLFAPHSSVSICAAVDPGKVPGFEGPSCRQTPMNDVDLTGRAVWVRAVIDLEDADPAQLPPMGLFVSARAATRAYVNGTFVGSNGVPSIVKGAETPGTLDSVFYVPNQLLKPGANSVVLLASGHAPTIVKSQALHGIGFAAYRQPPLMILPRYIPALLAFGALLAGAIYFLAMGAARHGDRASLALGLAALLAASQLLVEALRGLWAYPYPVHGMRLAVLLALTLGVGIALASHTLLRMGLAASRRYLAVLAVLGVCGVFLLPSFDSKMDWAVLAPSIGSCGLALLGLRQRRPSSGAYAAAFLALVVLLLLDPVMFFDVHGFWAFAALLLFLFVREARSLRETERQREEAEGRRRQLEAALERLASPGPAPSLMVNDAGRQLRIVAKEIAALSGAGDYVELRLRDGRNILHNGSLAALETSLPATFLRVHRSHIVNLDEIAELRRTAGALGELRLSNGTIVPVSRRIMPQVRRAFAASSNT